jgi:ketosteroid isomerase-like protein
MSQENVAIVRAAFDAWARGDVDALLELMHPEVTVVQPQTMPGGATLHGHAGVMEAIEMWPEQWDDYRIEVVQIDDAGGNALLVRTHQRGRGRATGIEVAEDFWFLLRFRDSKIVEWRIFDAEREAREAVGPTE